jgi:hypothetical protein
MAWLRLQNPGPVSSVLQELVERLLSAKQAQSGGGAPSGKTISRNPSKQSVGSR